MVQNLHARGCFHGTKDDCVQRLICYDSHSSAHIKHIIPQQYFKLLTKPERFIVSLCTVIH